jgi:hypothetical protein
MRVRDSSGTGGGARRAWNIAFRTTHIGMVGVLLGGHVFAISKVRLLPWLWLALASGAALALVEVSPLWRSCFEGRTLMLAFKLLVLCAIPFAWGARVPLLFLVVVVAGVASHLPRKYRHAVWLPGEGR